MLVSLSPVNLNKTVTDFWQCEHRSLGVAAESVSDRSEHFENCRFVILVKTQFTRIMYAMKPRYSFASIVLLILTFACAVCISTVAQGGPSSGYLHSRHAPGHLIVDRTPNFGWNLAFNLQIDGRPVANVAQGHTYSAWLPAGHHVLTVHKVPMVGYTEPTSTTVNIQPGVEYRFIAMWNSGLVYLQPTGVALTPGAFWQNHGDGTP
jgi:hypothetical protein